jgi:hypothetical protein
MNVQKPENVPLTLYGNLLIDNQEKLSILKITFPQWVNYWGSDVVIRVRGKLADETIEFCTSVSPNIRLLKGSSFLQWRKQSVFDIRQLESNFIMLYLEDHMLANDPPSSKDLLNDLEANEIDVFQYSWHQQYLKVAETLLRSNSSISKVSISTEIDRSLLKHLLKVDPRYLISLTSIFQRDFLIKLLDSPRPYLRKLDPRSPFDVEQKPTNTWYLPMTFGVPLSEFGICVDDDNTVVGSSAIARGLYSGVRPTRGETHHSSNSSISLAWKLRYVLFGKSKINFIPLRIKLLLTTIIFWPTYISYSLQAPILRFLDKFNFFWQQKRKLSGRH